MTPNQYNEGLAKNKANFTPLSPLTFIKRAAYVYPNKPSLVYGKRRFTWKETYQRTRQLAAALQKNGLQKGETVSILGFNTPETYEAHFGVPMAGGVLHAINTRLDAKNIAFMMDHANTKICLLYTSPSPRDRG